jgi:predicted phosphodiesterase
LDWYANDILTEDPELKVIVMGHTHESTKDNEYGNDGCWCMSGVFGHAHTDPTYVEIDGENTKVVTWRQEG